MIITASEAKEIAFNVNGFYYGYEPSVSTEIKVILDDIIEPDIIKSSNKGEFSVTYDHGQWSNKLTVLISRELKRYGYRTSVIKSIDGKYSPHKLTISWRK